MFSVNKLNSKGVSSLLLPLSIHVTVEVLLKFKDLITSWKTVKFIEIKIDKVQVNLQTMLR